MYDNIGGKIKGIAKAVFIVEAIAAVIAGIALVAIDEDLILFGVLTLILGPAVAWVSSWLLYVFGELIDKFVKLPLTQKPHEMHQRVPTTKSIKNILRTAKK